MMWLSKKYREYKKECKHKATVMALKSRGLLNRHVVDSLHGPVIVEIESNLKWIRFNSTNMGVSLDEDLTRISLYIHEFTEQIIGYMILEILVHDKFTLEEISDTFDGIVMFGSNNGRYNPQIKHIMTALHTISHIDDMEVDGDQYAEFFGIIKEKKISKCRLCAKELTTWVDWYKTDYERICRKRLEE